MASSSHLLFPCLLIALLCATVSAGRPCKTLFITSYSVSIKPVYSNPNHRVSGFVTVITSSIPRDFFPTRHPFFPAVDRTVNSPQQIRRPERQESLSYFPFGSYDMSSFRDRTKDILSVVVALLFGVGCGALTAASMYLVWSIFSTRSYEFDDQESDDDVSPKKMGYVKVPGADSVKA